MTEITTKMRDVSIVNTIALIDEIVSCETSCENVTEIIDAITTTNRTITNILNQCSSF